MKGLFPNLYTLAIVFMLSASFSVHAAQNPLTDAERTVGAYLNALKNGDVQAIKGLICGPLLKKRERLLNNPGYPSHLTDAYRNTRFTVLRSTVTDRGGAIVDVSIALPGGEDSQRQFILEKSDSPLAREAFCIYAERSL